MLLPELEYAKPSTLEEAIRLLSEHPDGRALAGGQTLVNVLKARAAAPDVLVDLNGLDELRAISRGADGSLEVGAMTTYADLVLSPEINESHPVLAETAATIADVQVRNRGTIGGNVCLSDPTNHLPPVVVALDGRMTIVGPEGERAVPAEEFFVGVYSTAVGPGDVLTRLTFPAGRRASFAAITIGKDGTCIANAAAALDGGAPRVVLGCVDAVPVRAREMESRLADAELDEASVREAAKGLAAELDPPSDVHASADYRRHLAEVCAVRAVLRAASRGRA